MWLVSTSNYESNKKRKPRILIYYCPVCGCLLQDESDDLNARLNHAFSHSLSEWQASYDAEDFVTDFLSLHEFYQTYGIRNVDTRKILLHVGKREGADLRGRESTGNGSRETSMALLARANKALGIEFVQDFADREGFRRNLAVRIRARNRARERTRVKNRSKVIEGSITFESDCYRRPTRDLEEIRLIKEGETILGKLELTIPYRKKTDIKFAKDYGGDYPSRVLIDWFDILPEFRKKGLGQSCYYALERIIREKYNPAEIVLKSAVWNPRPFWEKMSYSLVRKDGSLDTMVKRFHETGGRASES
jgi:GNAT superfamily N-acetyltransferase